MPNDSADSDNAGCPCRTECCGAAIEGRPKTIVTLVHGTGAKHADWMRDELPARDAEWMRALGFDLLSNALRRRVAGETEVVRWCWSGRNRHADRLEAGTRLAKHLTTLAGRHDKARLFVIGHSHGGNVALYAMNTPELLSTIRRRGGGIVTMATPFLQVRRRRLPVQSKATLAAAAVLGLMGWLASVLYLVFGGYDRGWWLSIGVVVISILVGVPLAVSAISYRHPNLKKTTFFPFARGNDTKSRRKQEINDLTLPTIHTDDLYVIRPTGDEASEVLVAAQFGSWLTAKYLRGVGWLGTYWVRFLMAVFLVVLLAGVVGYFSQGAEEWLSDVGEGAYLLGSTLLVAVVGAAGLVGLVLLVGAAVPFGRDGLFWPFLIEMTAESAPLDEVLVLTVDVSVDGMLDASNDDNAARKRRKHVIKMATRRIRHSRIYYHPRTITAIVDHLNG